MGVHDGGIDSSRSVCLLQSELSFFYCSHKNLHFSRARFFFFSTITSDSSILAGCCVRIFDKLMGWRYDGGGHCDGILIFWGILDGVLMVDCCGGFRSAAF